MQQARNPIEIWPIEIWIETMEARVNVLETLLGSFLLEAGRTHPDNVEHVRAVMRRAEETIIQAVRHAPEDKRSLAQATRQQFTQISAALTGQLPHHGKH